ncbi:MAG: hypothetical protein PHR00_00615 [Patescibacteria group bacterium]|nr:hypothetical protein [Patescibacteria group bacterium]
MNKKIVDKSLSQTAKEYLQELLSKAASESKIVSGEHLLDIVIAHHFLAKDLIIYAEKNLTEDALDEFLKGLFGKTQESLLKKKILKMLLKSKARYYWAFVINHSDDSQLILRAAKKILKKDPADNELGLILEKNPADCPAYSNLRQQALEILSKRSDNGQEKNGLSNHYRLQLMVKHGYIEGKYSEINLPPQEQAAVMLLNNTTTNVQDLLLILKVPTDFDGTYKSRTIEVLKNHTSLNNKNILAAFVGGPNSTKYLLMDIIMTSNHIQSPEEWATILIHCQKSYYDRVFEKYMASVGDGKNSLAEVLKSLLKIIAEHPLQLYQKHSKDLFIGLRALIKADDINPSEKKEISKLLKMITDTDESFKKQTKEYTNYLFVPEVETTESLLRKLIVLK